MSGSQSQAPSTHHIPLDTRLKKALRLNRDHCLVSACGTDTGIPENRGDQLQHSENAAVQAVEAVRRDMCQSEIDETAQWQVAETEADRTE